MADGHGGYRRPSNPAPVSGPGKHSRRTDGRPEVHDLPDAKYGEARDFEEIQRGAQMGGGPSTPVPAPSAQPVQMPRGLGDATAYPGQPVTAGAAAGPGPGMEALGLPAQDEASDLARRYGELIPLLIRRADDPTASQEFRDQVRYVLSRIG